MRQHCCFSYTMFKYRYQYWKSCIFLDANTGNVNYFFNSIQSMRGNELKKKWSNLNVFLVLKIHNETMQHWVKIRWFYSWIKVLARCLHIKNDLFGQEGIKIQPPLLLEYKGLSRSSSYFLCIFDPIIYGINSSFGSKCILDNTR